MSPCPHMPAAVFERVAGNGRLAAMVVELDQRRRPDQALERRFVDRLAALDEVVRRIDVGRHVGEHGEGRALPAAILEAVGRGEPVLEAEAALAVLDGNGEVDEVRHAFLLVNVDAGVLFGFER